MCTHVYPTPGVVRVYVEIQTMPIYTYIYVTYAEDYILSTITRMQFLTSTSLWFENESLMIRLLISMTLTYSCVCYIKTRCTVFLQFCITFNVLFKEIALDATYGFCSIFLKSFSSYEDNMSVHLKLRCTCIRMYIYVFLPFFIYLRR